MRREQGSRWWLEGNGLTTDNLQIAYCISQSTEKRSRVHNHSQELISSPTWCLGGRRWRCCSGRIDALNRNDLAHGPQPDVPFAREGQPALVLHEHHLFDVEGASDGVDLIMFHVFERAPECVKIHKDA